MSLRGLLLLLVALMPMPSAADDQIKAVQQALRERKLYFGSADGTMSPGLRKAVREFQELRGFDATGTVTTETKAALGVDATLDPEDRERQSVYTFLQRYLESREKTDLDAEMECYADTVDYFEDGTVDRMFIRHTARASVKNGPLASSCCSTVLHPQ